jgi:DNA mismatch repair protein MutS2
MTLYEKSLTVLELPAVLELLAAEAIGTGAKELAAALRPATDKYEVENRLAETTAAKNMMTVKGSPPLTAMRDITGSVRRADIGGVLNTSELLDVALVLRTAGNAVSYASNDRVEKTEIDSLFYALTPNKFLEGKISTSIVGVDEIADAASAELANIRRHMRIAGDKVRQALNKIVSSPNYAKALQEPIITMRNDRYVVPVKAEFKNAVPGLVHDISSSGATLFVEPMSAVQANNEIRELLAKEKKEIERILMELSADVAAHGEDIINNFRVLTQLDLIFAKAKLSYKLKCTEPILADDEQMILKRARHPLLPAKTVVPIDVRLGGDFDTLVITGPNTGGKTVSLKTIGLSCAMAQCGLHIPADDGSCVPVFEKILADIGDEQSIEQSLSTFSAHMTNIVRILNECTDQALLLFDELGAGTDPVEGAALAISVIEHARKQGAHIAATTHYAELKIYATTTKGVQNASCEFDVETLRPTYKLLIGIPGKSNAFAISARLGLPAAIIADAKSRIDSENTSFEEVLENLEKTRQQMETQQMETQRRLRAAEENERKSEEYRKRLEREQEKASLLARREADRIIQEAREAADAVFDELRVIRKRTAKEQDWQQVNAARSEMYRRLNAAEDHLGSCREKAAPPPSARPVKPGDRVRINDIGTVADVIAVSPDRVLTLQAGIMKITAKEDEVRLVEGESRTDTKKIAAQSAAKLRATPVKPELDIRGMMTDEAVPVVERFIDSAEMSKLNTVTIIHGKGTGALRKAVHQCLRKNSQVKSFRLGRYGEGETGVTVVELR